MAVFKVWIIPALIALISAGSTLVLDRTVFLVEPKPVPVICRVSSPGLQMKTHGVHMNFFKRHAE
jgi:hypothetical protein